LINDAQSRAYPFSNHPKMNFTLKPLITLATILSLGAFHSSAQTNLIITNSAGDIYSVNASAPETSYGSLSGGGNLVGVGSWGGANFAVANSAGTFTVYNNTLAQVATSSGHGIINALAATPDGNAVVVTAAGLGINLSGSNGGVLASGDWSDGTKSLLKVASFANSDVAMTRSDFGIITASTTQGFVGYNGANDSINQAIVVTAAQTYLVGRANGGMVGWNASGAFQSFNNGFGDIRSLAVDTGTGLFIGNAAGQLWRTDQAALQNAGDITATATGLGTITSVVTTSGTVIVGNAEGTITILDGTTLATLSSAGGFGEITGLAVVAAIPEPSTFAAFAGLAVLGLAATRRRALS
jgi:hypothetical protein